MRTTKQPAEQIRGSSQVERAVLLARQREDLAEGLRATKHGMVLRPRDIRRQGYETHDEQRQDEVQENAHRQAHERPHHRGEG